MNNYLLNIFSNKHIELTNFNLLKKFMINASECLYKNCKYFYNELISLLPCLMESVQLLIELFQKNILNNAKYFEENSFIYNSFIFRSFYFIIELLLANKKFIIKKEYIILFYKILFMIDKFDINYNKCLDMDNLIEINYKLNNDNKGNLFNNSRNVAINLKKNKNIIIKTNILSNDEYKKFDRFRFIKIDIFSGLEKIPFKFLNGEDFIYKDVSQINIQMNWWYNYLDNDYIINIIPVKDGKLFNKYNSKDYRIFSLLEKSIIHYLLYLFDNIHYELEQYNNNKIIKNYKTKFENELFKFISIPKKQNLTKNKSHSEFSFITSDFFEKIYIKENNIENLDILYDELKINFEKMNKEISINESEFQKENTIKIEKLECDDYFLNNINLDKLFKIFNLDLPKKKSILIMQIRENKNLNLLINQIFLFGIKYYNYYENLKSLLKKLENYNLEDINAIKNEIKQIRLLDDFSLFYSFYEESINIISIYHKNRANFNDLNFYEENKKYFDNNFEKIKFLFDNIITCDTIKPDNLIIKNLIEFLDDDEIGINEIIKYLKIQNINFQIKLIELLIINNFLLYLNNETSIILILNLIKINKNICQNNELTSIFDNVYGADYFIIEKVEHLFNQFFGILSNKIINNENNYSIITKISLMQNLIWKIKGRDFPILEQVLNLFEEIKTGKIEKEEKEKLFFFNNNNDNIKYFNEKNIAQYKFELFKILIPEIINIIKEILRYKYENDNKLSFKRSPSNISTNFYKKLLKKILSFFFEINQDNIYYYDLILFFYKIFVSSEYLIDFILQTDINIINKVMKIAFYDDNNDDINKVKRNNTRLIMIKLLAIILENINDDNLKDLSENIHNLENGNPLIQNRFSYLYEKIIIELNCNNKIPDLMIKKYLENLLLICINKIIETEKEKTFKFEIILNNIFDLILYDDKDNYTSECIFYIKSKDNDFRKSIFYIKSKYNDSSNLENYSLLNSEVNKELKFGKIICFIEDDFKNFNIGKFNLSDKKIEFYKSNIKYNSINKNSNILDNYKALILMKDFEELDFYDINNIETIKISDIEIINTENRYKKNFFEKNSKLIIEIIKEKIDSDKLNEKGIYLAFKLLSKIIKYTNKDNLIMILEILSKFYFKNKEKEIDYPFMSLEYLEKKVIENKKFQFKNLKNIYNE